MNKKHVTMRVERELLNKLNDQASNLNVTFSELARWTMEKGLMEAEKILRSPEIKKA